VSNFWDIIWDIFYIFLFVAYLMVLFRIWIDLFSDSSLGGVSKAIWIIVLIFMPFFGALIYVIARGRGMAERQMSRIAQAQSDTDAYIQHVAGEKSSAEQIADAKALLDSGAVTPAEFDRLKAKALA
jgi:ABC-type multidrug transport system fused ATPase/permease subunit